MLPEYASNAPIARDDLQAPDFTPNTPEQEKAHQEEIKHFHKTVPQLKPMSANEHAAKWKEENDAKVKGYKFDKQKEIEQYRPGKLLSHGEFLRLLRKIRPDVFINDFSAVGRIGLNLIENGKPIYTGTTVQYGMSPEFSKIRVDAHGVGQGEQFRGWRTTLLHLVSRGFVTEDQVHKVFGKPSGYGADRYLRLLWEMRNKRLWPYAA
jgi:hypothetical protein